MNRSSRPQNDARDAKSSGEGSGLFRKRPVVVEAFRLGFAWPDWWAEKHIQNEVTTHNVDGRWAGGPDVALIHTLEGVMRAEYGDWIIKGVKGEVYPCKPHIFAETYEPAEDASPLGAELGATGNDRGRDDPIPTLPLSDTREEP